MEEFLGVFVAATSHISHQSFLNKSFCYSKLHPDQQQKYYKLKDLLMRKMNQLKQIWIFGLAVVKEIDFSFRVIVGFMLRERFYQQTYDEDAIFKPSLIIHRCVIGTEKHPNDGIKM